MDRPVHVSRWNFGACGDLTARDSRHLRSFNIWGLAWARSWVIASILINRGLVPAGWPSAFVALLPTAVGVLMLRAYAIFLRDADELHRKVHLEALAVAFGAGAVFMVGYSLLESAGAPDLDVSDPLLVMMVVWAIAQTAGMRRYR